MRSQSRWIPSGIPRKLLDFFFPPICSGCRKEGSYLCSDCKTKLKLFEFSICPVCDRPTILGKTHPTCLTTASPDGNICLYHYSPPASSYLKKIKYQGVFDAVRELPTLLNFAWPDYAPDLDALIPVPMHEKKRQSRGFNQASMLADHLGETLNLPVWHDVLIKTTQTTPQAEKKRKQRKKLQQCFELENSNRVANNSIGIVDDVSTTGTTLKLATAALKTAHPKQVWTISFAHAY